MTHRAPYLDPLREETVVETSAEDFDRMAFAEEAFAMLALPRLRLAICPGSTRLHVEVGRQWGGAPGERWAMVTVPPTASREAIARAVAVLSTESPRAYALDTLMAAARRPAP